MNGFCNETGVGLIPWARLCRGHLARPPEDFGASEASERSALEKGADSKAMVSAFGSPRLDEADLAIVKRVMEIADEKRWPMGRVALGRTRCGERAEY
ncbi:hypothetical protein BJX65DRAFT_274435 [Aspergillus insuetus]